MTDVHYRSIRSLERKDGLVHIASQTEHEHLGSTVYVECAGEDTILAWRWCADAVPTCFECIAKRNP